MAAVVVSRRLRAAAPTVVAQVARAAGCSVRAMSGKADKDAMSNADITKYFLDLDAGAKKDVGTDLPIKLTGRSGEIVAQLYAAGSKAKNFDKIVKDFQGIVAAVQASGLVVDRFFSTNNYSEEECRKVVDLLLTTKEPLTSFKDIKDADVKDILVDNEGNLDAWRNARKAIAALSLTEESKAALGTMADEAALSRVKLVAEKAADLRSAVSKTVDAVVSSAIPLSKAQQDAIKAALPTYAPAGQSVSVNFVVDPAVLGGLRIDMKNTTIDLTSTSRLVDVIANARAAAKLN